MKFLFAICFLIAAIGSQAKKPENVTSPLDSPQYEEILKKLIPYQAKDQIDDKDRITNGETATEGQFPYQVLMYMTKSGGGTGLCGGSIINKRWILTAAHCIDSMKSVEVYFGTTDRNVPGSDPMKVEGSANIIMHPQYNKQKIVNDIALIKLPDDAPLGDNVGVVSLPKGDENLIDSAATVSGFGRTSDDNPQASDNLKYVTLQVVDESACSGYSSYRSDSQICVESVDAKSICNGDSGGPLVTGSDSDRVLVGVVSYGAAKGCALGYHGVFTKVSKYLSWIKQTTGESFA